MRIRPALVFLACLGLAGAGLTAAAPPQAMADPAAPAPSAGPVEQALNELTTHTGTLFVVSAGNYGAANTIGSPGAADAALTVGSVEKDDTLSESSSRGPAWATAP